MVFRRIDAQLAYTSIDTVQLLPVSARRCLSHLSTSPASSSIAALSSTITFQPSSSFSHFPTPHTQHTMSYGETGCLSSPLLLSAADCSPSAAANGLIGLDLDCDAPSTMPQSSLVSMQHRPWRSVHPQAVLSLLPSLVQVAQSRTRQVQQQ